MSGKGDIVFDIGVGLLFWVIAALPFVILGATDWKGWLQPRVHRSAVAAGLSVAIPTGLVLSGALAAVAMGSAGSLGAAYLLMCSPLTVGTAMLAGGLVGRRIPRAG